MNFLALVLAFGYPQMPAVVPGSSYFASADQVRITQKACPSVKDIPAPGACKILAGVPQCAPGATETDDLDIICHQHTSLRRCTFSQSFKAKMKAAYGVKVVGEVDHRIPLELGGSNAVTNLWPQGANYRQKDRVEGELHGLVCSGKMTLDAARILILNSWEQIAKAPPIHQTRGK